MLTGDDLAGALAPLVGADAVEGLQRLSAGASRETWAFDAISGETRRRLVLVRDARTAGLGLGTSIERRLLEAAAAAGVPVPRVVAGGDDGGLGAPFVVTEHLDGETIPRRILRDDTLVAARAGLAAQCGRALAAIHSIPLDAVPELPSGDQLREFRGHLDALGEPHPAFELAFRWLDAHRPAPTGSVIVHGDFRHGNLIVGPDGLRAVLDWELAHVGDPMEDLGWLCVKAWRFGAAAPVGGFGTREELFAAYEEASGHAVDPATVHWWEVVGTLKWGIMCIIQASMHLSGAVRSVELAAIGRRVCENEWDLLELIAP